MTKIWNVEIFKVGFCFLQHSLESRIPIRLLKIMLYRKGLFFRMKIISVVGARPQFIKAAVVSKALRSREGVKEIIVHTGQHYDENMSQMFFEEMEIPPPDYYLRVGSGPHGQQTGRMLERIEEVLLKEKPDWVLVYGDTNSTLAGALAAAKMHIPLAHVEAGLRSFNRRMPEEINRVLTDHMADILFAPTKTAVENLRREGIPQERVHLVGDVMYDAALFYGEMAEKKSSILSKLHLKPRGYILATVHRAENTDSAARLRAIFCGFQLAAAENGLVVVVPLHPRTRSALEREGLLRFHLEKQELTLAFGCAGVKLVGPVGYLDMLVLEKNARLIATDSGGIQKEAFFFRVPCITLRGETEWIELIESGWNRLVPPVNAEAVAEGIRKALIEEKDKGEFAGYTGFGENELFGGGKAAARLSKVIFNC